MLMLFFPSTPPTKPITPGTSSVFRNSRWPFEPSFATDAVHLQQARFVHHHRAFHGRNARICFQLQPDGVDVMPSARLMPFRE